MCNVEERDGYVRFKDIAVELLDGTIEILRR